jgi:hypothetical protein
LERKIQDWDLQSKCQLHSKILDCLAELVLQIKGSQHNQQIFLVDRHKELKANQVYLARKLNLNSNRKAHFSEEISNKPKTLKAEVSLDNNSSNSNRQLHLVNKLLLLLQVPASLDSNNSSNRSQLFLADLHPKVEVSVLSF